MTSAVIEYKNEKKKEKQVSANVFLDMIG